MTKIEIVMLAEAARMKFGAQIYSLKKYNCLLTRDDITLIFILLLGEEGQLKSVLQETLTFTRMSFKQQNATHFLSLRTRISS